ncbi:hypothetical protein [Confluentibacter lentus]|uniref:hypothetical protein n=1 Tax=Confluentibacter lentus TaxID=1699412 RepID=UPI000C290739|nr:hypothetical protein [Confluentibacter lentus]
MNHNNFEIEVISDYGSKPLLKQSITSIEIIIEIMNSLDWNDFQIVNLSKSCNDWISLSGNLSGDGLACVYKEKNQEFIIYSAPNTIQQMTEILVSYYKRDGEFKKKYKFIKEKNDYKSKESIDPLKYKKWKEKFLIRKKKEKIADVKKALLSILIIIFLSVIIYNWYTGELKFIGQNTTFTQATVVKTQMYHIGRGYYKQLVTYEFKYDDEIYQGTFKAGKSIGKQEVGNLIKIKFSISNPNRSLMVGF